MNNILKEVLTLGSFFLAGVLFVYLKGKVFNKAKTTIKKQITNSSIGNVYKKDGQEAFQWKKFFTGFGGLLNPVGWAKDIVGLLNTRKLAIYGIIIGVLMGWSFWKGQQGKPINVNLGYEEAVEIKVPNSDLRLYKPTNSNKLYWIDKEGNKIPITVADIPALKKALKPISFEFNPIGVLGVGSGLKNTGAEGGIGISFLRYWKWHLETFLTNYGLYLGTSYKLELFGMKNSSIGIGVGKGYTAGDDRAIIYYRWEF